MESIVTVISLCYNQEKFVVEALNSVLAQTYSPIEIIVVDDFSQDGSSQKIRAFLKDKPEISFIQNDKNLGNCKSFNKAYKISHGEYLIDFAADDVMEPDKVERQVRELKNKGEEYGIIHHDVQVTDENLAPLYLHSQFVENIIRKPIPQGIIFEELLRNYIVNSPSMMIKRHVFEELDGYDESLSYEDFDFWMRSSPKWKYHYLPDVLMKVRKVKTSMSSISSRKKIHAESTMKVCKKVAAMDLTRQGKANLRYRAFYEAKEALKRGNVLLGFKFIGLGLMVTFLYSFSSSK